MKKLLTISILALLTATQYIDAAAGGAGAGAGAAHSEDSPTVESSLVALRRLAQEEQTDSIIEQEAALIKQLAARLQAEHSSLTPKEAYKNYLVRIADAKFDTLPYPKQTLEKRGRMASMAEAKAEEEWKILNKGNIYTVVRRTGW